MKKSFFVYFIILIAHISLLFSHFSTIYAKAINSAPQINAKSWILLDYNSGKVLTEFNADKHMDPASLTKMMTSYIVGQKIKSGMIKYNDMVTIGTDAWATGNPKLKGSSLMFLKPGDHVSVYDLNKGIVIQSGNDACIALADYISGNQHAFVNLMNDYAKILGLKNTHFMTVHGLDSVDQYSTARDMALMGQALIRDVPKEYAIHKEKEFKFNHIRQINRNRLLWSHNLNVDGIKTGHTLGAGNNLVTSAVQGNTRLISVILGSPNEDIRFIESERLLTWGFNSFKTYIPVKANTPVIKEKVWFGKKDTAHLGINKDIAITIDKKKIKKNLDIEYQFKYFPLKAPLVRNEIIGTIIFKFNNKIIDKQPLIILNDIPKGSIFSQIIDFIILKIKTWLHKWF
ncbi:MAG: serine-type D-Ala-D-Ala carboxypeptidase [Pantoea sp. Brub]|nr:serine-type D-Ala-D-Ala carboxypeptidase [Pantoea sp. Brub]